MEINPVPPCGPRGRIFQINLSDGGVPKLPVSDAYLGMLGLEGDRQRTPDIHGGPERAVCLYALELIQALQAEGHPIYPGAVGENLTLVGLDWSLVKPGARLYLGSEARIEITRYTSPCKTIAAAFQQGDFNRISPKLSPGWSRCYGRVLTPGWLHVGDPVWIEPDPA